ncbi:uncharacterized protein LOC127720435 [Mytilus californianus]|uniref:uncharacterized protein LOC127720435 n=1 Tax=Mytilus californianus TaxID=6549 RepID=UPI0022474347|nr:uncharacterized protein LOC127720435 [Mytilus californianus]
MEGNCTVHRILFYIDGCIDDQELAGVMLGVFSAALWTLVHISFYTNQRRTMKINRYVMSSIMLHMIADGLSCIGAILAQQKSLQVIFALFGTVVNAAIGLHCWCSRTPSNDNIGTDQKGTKRKPVTEKYHCLCSALFLTLCLMFITMCVTEYLTISDDKIVYESSAKQQPYMHTIVIVGYILGSIGAVSYWFSKFYEIVESYRQTKHKGVHTCMYLTAITGDTTYLIGVYIQMSTVVYIIKTLPWTLARMGLIGIHVGIIFQRSCSSSREQTDDNVTLLKENRKSDESDWSDDSSTVICGTCDLQTSVKQIICRESPLFDKEITLYEKGVTEKVYYDKGDNPAINKDTNTNMESASSESPELEWDFEWSSDTKKRQFSKMDINKVSPYNGYYKVVEWFKKSCDIDSQSDVDDFTDSNNIFHKTGPK